ncbi:MAG: T9SS type A sorting domain-containing protein, partial [Chitinophagaceae bacterium]|nr:T9SS type A sorting domain-containing protein [Chitinophagaceae bacterium]
AYNPVFNLPGKGYINFLVEKIGGKLQVLNDVTIGYTDKPGELLVQIPAAGTYKFTITSKYQSTVDIQIDAGKNIFYKSGTFFGNTTEIYTDVNNMPGYFYVPAGIDKVYFSISNSNPGGNGFASPEKINKEFEIKDNDGNSITARFVTSKDSALFYIPIPEGSRGKFCRITKKSNYGLLFSNISNYLWYAQPKPTPCKNSNFTISVLKIKENCITRLTANNISANYEWHVNDNGNNFTYSGQPIIDLPANSSPNTSITLTTDNNCSTTKKLKEDKNYLQAIQACAAGATLPGATGKPVIYPNPTTGYFTCMMNGVQLKADELNILNVQGTRVADFNQANGFNIGNLPAGIYWYKLKVKEKEYSGRLIKL